LVLGLQVDGGEHAVGGHAGEQVQAADAGSGPELDDGLRRQGGGQEPQRGPGPRADRPDAEVAGSLARRGDGLVLRDEQVGEAEAHGTPFDGTAPDESQVTGNGPPAAGAAPQRRPPTRSHAAPTRAGNNRRTRTVATTVPEEKVKALTEISDRRFDTVDTDQAGAADQTGWEMPSWESV